LKKLLHDLKAVRNDNVFCTVFPHVHLAMDDSVTIMCEMRLIRLLVSLSSGMLPISFCNDEADDVGPKEKEIAFTLASNAGEVAEHAAGVEK
jgi:hypothetical protein